jgi:hypothetical protein
LAIVSNSVIPARPSDSLKYNHYAGHPHTR